MFYKYQTPDKNTSSFLFFTLEFSAIFSEGKFSEIKLPVSILGQTTGYIIYTAMSREPIRLPEIQYPVFYINYKYIHIYLHERTHVHANIWSDFRSIFKISFTTCLLFVSSANARKNSDILVVFSQLVHLSSYKDSRTEDVRSQSVKTEIC